MAVLQAWVSEGSSLPSRGSFITLDMVAHLDMEECNRSLRAVYILNRPRGEGAHQRPPERALFRTSRGRLVLLRDRGARLRQSVRGRGRCRVGPWRLLRGGHHGGPVLLRQCYRAAAPPGRRLSEARPAGG